MKQKAGLLSLSAILIVNAFVLHFLAFRGFNFYDFGGFLDASWRVLNGQRPYLDFIYTTGPVHLYLNAFFFLLFGFGKLAIFAHLLVVSSVVIAATFWSVARLLPLALSIVCAILTMTGFYWSFPHPWYDHSAYVWGFLGIWIMLKHFPLEEPKRAFRAGLASGALVALSFFTKTNIGFAFGGVFFLVLISVPNRLNALKGLIAGAVAGTVLLMIAIQSPAAYIDNAFLNYGIAHTVQMQRFFYLRAWLMNYYWVPFVIATVNWLVNRMRQTPLFLLAAGTPLVAIFAMNTGSLREPAHVQLMGISIGLALALLYQLRKEFRHSFQKAVFYGSVLILVVQSLWQTNFTAHYAFRRALGGFDLGILSMGNYALRAKPLRGWLLNPTDGRMVDEIADYIQVSIPKTESLLILTDLQILYALTGRESYRGVPFLFDIEEVPAPGKQTEWVRRHITENPPDWLLTHREEGPFPVNRLIPYLGLPENFLSRYQLAKTWGSYGLFKKRA